MGIKHYKNHNYVEAEKRYKHAYEALSTSLGSNDYLARHNLKRLKLIMAHNHHTMHPTMAPTKWSADLTEGGTAYPTKAPTPADPNDSGSLGGPYENGSLGEHTARQRGQETAVPTSHPTSDGEDHFTFAPSYQPTQDPTALVWHMDDPLTDAALAGRSRSSANEPAASPA
jgi:hypothetical protein